MNEPILRRAGAQWVWVAPIVQSESLPMEPSPRGVSKAGDVGRLAVGLFEYLCDRSPNRLVARRAFEERREKGRILAAVGEGEKIAAAHRSGSVAPGSRFRKRFKQRLSRDRR